MTFDHAYKAFLHGDLKQGQDEAHLGRERFKSEPEWAWKFGILEAESLLWRGMYAEALTTLDHPSARPDDKDSQIEIFAVEGVARASLRQFPEAESELEKATQMCLVSSEATCGDVTRARGILAVQEGHIEAARQFFEQSLRFARAHDDHFLEITALLNLGLTSLREEHFDEAIDWADAAYKTSTAFGANGEAEVAVGNLGWAYFNLGDSEKSLELSTEAEGRASQAGKVIDQLYWITNAGYVYAGFGDLPRAKQSYLEALNLATEINDKEGIYNALRALALVSVESGELDDARRYSDQAIAIAHADNNRSDELYPLLVKGLIAARLHDGAEAERIFREVEQDEHGSASLKWRSEHGLARLYEAENRPSAANREYRTALTTFETARSELKHEDSRLPFLSNASRIYGDYIHFLVAQGKAAEALQVADFSRGRTLAEGLGFLQKGTSFKPDRLDAPGVARQAGGTIFFYWLGEKQSYLWAITAKKISLFPLPAAPEIEAAVERYQKAVEGPQDVLATSDAGASLYRMLIAPARDLLPANARVVIIPDGKLNNLNFETLPVPEPAPHYWIEDVTVVNASSLRLLAASRASKRKVPRSLLLFGNAISASPDYPELPNATVEMASVEKHFATAQERVFQRDQATPAAYLASDPDQFSYIHFVAHGMANRLSPLDSFVVLSRDSAQNESFKLYARDIIQHPVRAELVTISACYGAGTRAYSGEGLVGLSWAFLRSGAHNVVAALWDASDVSTGQLMDKFYDGLNQGENPATALRQAKLSLLHSDNAFRKPFYWGPFQLYSGS